MAEAPIATMSQAFSLAGQVALVTGGGSGLGKAITRALTACGATVIIAGRRQSVLDETAGEIGTKCHAQTLDLQDTDSLAEFESSLAERYGAIDILVNNAGNSVKKPFEESNPDDLDSVLDVHIRGALELSRLVIRRQIATRGGSIQFISSMTAFIGQPNVLGYTVSKAALSGAVRGLTAEFAARNVRINGIAPGWIDTDLYRQAIQGDSEREDKILNRIPMGHLGQPEDIGWACAYLSSPAAKYVTGQILLVDGGGAIGF